jgi:hypothetical protein
MGLVKIEIHRPPTFSGVASNFVGIEQLDVAVGEGVVGLAIAPLASMLVLLQPVEAGCVLRTVSAGVRAFDPPTVVGPRRQAAAAAVSVPNHFRGGADFGETMQGSVFVNAWILEPGEIMADTALRSSLFLGQSQY